MREVEHELRLAFSTGKVQIGSKESIRSLQRNRAKIAIISNNCPKDIKENIKTLGSLGSITVLEHNRDSIELGELCGKPFPVSAIVINEPGDSKILDFIED
jgi:large subunit ribosomal protein L30e